MREVTEVHNVYTYEELSAQAKEKVKEWYLDDPLRPQEFEVNCMNELRILFPGSNLRLQFSLSSCQGDGLNIYGTLYLPDLLGTICSEPDKNEISEEERETIKSYMEICGDEIDIPYNNTGYAYCVASHISFTEDWISELEYNRQDNVQVDAIRKLERFIINYFTKMSDLYEKEGYEYFYEADESEIAEACAANNWEFLENGKYYPN